MGGFSSNKKIVPAIVEDWSIIWSLHILSGIHSGSSGMASGAWPATNLAIYVPFIVHGARTIKRILVHIGGATSGNVDAGIYAEDGTKKVTIGSTAVGTGNEVQELDITDTALTAGRYFMALAFDNTTVACIRAAVITKNRVIGVKEETSAFPLPSSATYVESASRAYIPSFSLSLVT